MYMPSLPETPTMQTFIDASPVRPRNAQVQLPACYNHRGVAASERCLSTATFVSRLLRVPRLVRTLPAHPDGDRMQQFIGRVPLVGALVFILAGCGADAGTSPVSIVGSYRLASVDGAPIPVTLAP